MPAQRPVAVAVLGAGLIGKRHIAHVLSESCASLAAIVDPSPDARTLAEQSETPWFPDLATLLRHATPEAIIVATPNRMHVANGLDSVAAGIPVLVEKPLADEVADALRLVEAAEQAGVPLLVGHHRRHNPLISAAKQAIDAGRIGRIVAVHALCWFHKSNDYFETAWRREKGAGPVLLNLIHDVDLLRHLCGEVVAVQAMESNGVRGHAVEDTAVILLRLADGVLATISVSDTIAAPWSWELTSGENADYHQTDEAAYVIGGTMGSLTIPHLDLWQHDRQPSWWEKIGRARLPAEAADPLALQIRNLCAVVRGTARPVVSGREGLQTLKVIAAIKQAAVTGRTVDVASSR